MKQRQSPSRAEKLFVVEAAYGRAMLRAHGIEQMLTTWLICAVCYRKQRATWRNDVAVIKQLTLGGLIKRFVAESSAPAALSEELSTLLTLRNDLAHRVSARFADAAKNKNWEQHALLELSSVGDRLAKCRAALQPYMVQAREMAGLTEEEISNVIDRTFPGARAGA